MNVPQDIKDGLALLYPDVELIYSMGQQRFVLVHMSPKGLRGVLRVLQDQDGGFVWPHFANTIGWLHEHDSIHLTNDWQREAFLNSLDDHKRQYDRRQQSMLSDRVREELAPQLRRLILANKVPILPRRRA